MIEAEQVVPEAVPSRPEARTGMTVHPVQLPTALPQHLIMGNPTSSGATLLSHLTVIRQLALILALVSGILISTGILQVCIAAANLAFHDYE